MVDPDRSEPHPPTHASRVSPASVLTFSRPLSLSRRRSPSTVAAPPLPCPGLGTGLFGQEAGWLGSLPGLASVWAGHEAGSLRHRPGLAPVWAGSDKGWPDLLVSLMVDD